MEKSVHGRKQYSLKNNDSISLSDPLFIDHTDPNTKNYLPSKAFIVRCQILLEPYQVIAIYRSHIEEHILRRVDLAFLQLIACWNTKYHFEIVQARAQARSPKKIIMQDRKKGQIILKRNACHSSTSPCVIAYEKTSYVAYSKQKAERPQGFVYLEGTDLYRYQNSTINLPECVNLVDTSIEGTIKNQKLKKVLAELLNQTAAGETLPHKALNFFVQYMLNIIEVNQDKLQKTKEELNKNCMNLVLEMYKAAVTQFLRSPEEKYLNLVLNTFKNSCSKKVSEVLKTIRYSSIQTNLSVQFEITQMLNSFLAELKQGIHGTEEGVYLKQALRAAVLANEAVSQKEKNRLQKFLSFSVEAFENFIEQKHRFREQFQELSKTPSVQNLVFSILQVMKKARTEEVLLRGSITHTIRKASKMTKAKLLKELNKDFPKLTLNHLRSFESGELLVPNPVVYSLCSIFGIDSVYYITENFYS